MSKNTLPESNGVLLTDLRELINQAQQQVTMVVNSTLTMLYWQIGRRINDDILKGERAEYGQTILLSISKKLSTEFGKGFSRPALTKMCLFHQLFPDSKICLTLSNKLSWSHFVELLPLKNPLQRDFYVQMSQVEKWSVRTLRGRIDSMLYERTALSKKPEEMIANELQTLGETQDFSPQMILKDPYVLDFLELNDHYYEKDLEDAILRELEKFLLELGAGFTFIARQKRLPIGNEDFYIDLLFYNRKLKRLLALELKLGKFKAEYKGQMELYLRYLAKHEQEEGEAPPLGIILCAGKDEEQIELLELDQQGIHVAEYLTELPSKKVLQQKLQVAIKQSCYQQENQKEGKQ